MTRLSACRLACVVLATVAFGWALMSRQSVNPWMSTTAAALVAMATALAVLQTRLRLLLVFAWRGVLVAAAVAVGLVVATHGAYDAASALAPGLAAEVGRLYQTIQAPPGPGAGAALTFFIVIAEELVWRGVVIELASARLGRPGAGAASVVAYTLPQALGGSWVLMAAAAALGTVLAVQRLASGRLTDSIVTHALWSMAIFSFVPLV